MELVKIRALQTFVGQEGRIKKGKVIEVQNIDRAFKLVKKGIAEFVVDEENIQTLEPGEPENNGANDQAPQQSENDHQKPDNTDEGNDDFMDKLNEFKTHDKIDAFASQLEIPNDQYPYGKDKATLDEKREIIAEFATEM